MAYLQAIRSYPIARKQRLGSLARTGNGFRCADRNKMLLDTCQPDSSEKFRWDRIPAPKKKNAGMSKRQIATLISATPEELVEQRTNDLCHASLVQTNAELIKFIATHPKAMYDLDPASSRN